MTDITLRLAQHLRGGEAELGRVVEHIALAGKIIAREISRARLIATRDHGRREHPGRGRQDARRVVERRHRSSAHGKRLRVHDDLRGDGRAAAPRDIRPTSVHQRVPVLIGSRDDVALAEDFVTGRSPKVVT